MLACRISFAYLARSALISAANSCGPPGSGSAPIVISCSLISGVFRILVISCESLSMRAFGVPAGAQDSLPRLYLITRQAALGESRDFRQGHQALAARKIGRASCRERV